MKKNSKSAELIVTINDYGYADSKFTKRELVDNDQINIQEKVIPTVQCRVCGKMVRRDRLAGHHKNAHAVEKTDLPSFVKTRQETVNSSSQTRKALPQLSRPAPQARRSLPATPPSGQVLIPCSYCNAPVAPKNMAKHLRKIHRIEAVTPQPASSPKVALKKPKAIRLPGTDAHHERCPECNSLIPRHKFQAHLRKMHDIWLKRDERNHYRKVGRRTRGQSSRASASDRLSRQQLEQSSDEPFDGGKHWGHIERENGRFGTFPLYDDYSEESTP